MKLLTKFKIDLIVWKWDKEVTEHYIIIEFKIDLIVWKLRHKESIVLSQTCLK